MTTTPTLEVRRAASRPTTDLGWLHSRHSFSFGPHHDPANIHHGLLLVSNDDRVAPGTGFDTHPHRTWRSSRGCSRASSSTRTRWPTAA